MVAPDANPHLLASLLRLLVGEFRSSTHLILMSPQLKVRKTRTGFNIHLEIFPRLYKHARLRLESPL